MQKLKDVKMQEVFKNMSQHIKMTKHNPFTKSQLNIKNKNNNSID